MPLYEYSCLKCQTRFEELVSSQRTAAPACPKCGEKNVRRELSVFAVNAGSSTTAAPSPCDSCSCSAGGCDYLDD